MKSYTLEFTSRGYSFKQAMPEDLDAMAEIELENFAGTDLLVTRDDMQEWYDHNSDMFYVIKDKNDVAVAFGIVLPVTAEGYEKFRRGEAADMQMLEKEDVKKTMRAEHFFVEDVCVTKSLSLMRIKVVGAMLLGGLANVVYNNGGVRTASTPVTDDGMIVESIGYKPLAVCTHNGEDYTIYDIPVTHEVCNKPSVMAGAGELPKKRSRKLFANTAQKGP